MSGRIRPFPNRSRPDWFFLTLQTPEANCENEIVQWELLVGNRHTTVAHVTENAPDYEHERELLSALLQEIQTHYRSSSELYTNDNETVELLRARLVISGVEEASLRGLQHIPLTGIASSFNSYWEDIGRFLEETDDDEISSDQVNLSVSEMLEVRRCVGGVVPYDVLEGRPL